VGHLIVLEGRGELCNLCNIVVPLDRIPCVDRSALQVLVLHLQRHAVLPAAHASTLQVQRFLELLHSGVGAAALDLFTAVLFS
jgi:hypothetical protein